MIRSVRILGAALGSLVGIAVVATVPSTFAELPGSGAIVVGWLVAWAVVGFSILPYLTTIPAARLVRGVQDISTAEFVTAVLGLLLGLLMGLLLGSPLSAFPAPFGLWLPIGVSVFLGLGMVGLTVAKREDLLIAAEAIGLVRRPTEAADGAASGPHILVDSSAIIDGRIAEIVESGFLFGTLVVPRFVLDEVQKIADSSDTLRRNRGRRGLEILTRMQKDSPTPVVILDDDVPEVAEVDAKLVALAKRFSRAVLTNDFNLNRVAELQGVRILNVNSLANAVKPALLPGEGLKIRVIQPGKEAAQGVGFLDDGTMIVVEGGARFMDSEIEVEVTRVLQTVAGRMVFAQPRHD
ncbi:MAG: PIN domain-containing protein [Chloroflexota bacterium]